MEKHKAIYEVEGMKLGFREYGVLAHPVDGTTVYDIVKKLDDDAPEGKVLMIEVSSHNDEDIAKSVARDYNIGVGIGPKDVVVETYAAEDIVKF